MGSHRERPPLLIRPGFSRRFAGFVGVTHLAAAAAVITLLGDSPLWLILLIPVTISALYIGYVDVLRRAPWSIRSALWEPDGTWRIRFVSGAEREARLSPATFITLPLVVLSFRLGLLGRGTLPIFADALDPDQLRRLRQRLRIEGITRDGPRLIERRNE
ncbi:MULTISPECIES: protein YgfX [unclassified Thiocapsa]|uniref:protein YgfX n=1 Tax=unclassified Thiocapsa TaxID=2641286 RepID=UPI0035ADED47